MLPLVLLSRCHTSKLPNRAAMLTTLLAEIVPVPVIVPPVNPPPATTCVTAEAHVGLPSGPGLPRKVPVLPAAVMPTVEVPLPNRMPLEVSVEVLVPPNGTLSTPVAPVVRLTCWNEGASAVPLLISA